VKITDNKEDSSFFDRKLRIVMFGSAGILKIRAADAKEVGVGNPAEETCCHPNERNVTFP
jgi:hypothetical protein